ncbi:hypothetical protein RF55_14523 [Lasius niger]|uniref:Endonuclease/exonuclease/phosphatase domain-containing protein n=1 Tax=Lasius niger TaxID=67767 RepID=A0A0J7K869_LASNI|nr:hypothetical protein RF55_14523 [Lasius niger]
MRKQNEDRLSTKEVNKLKKWVEEKEKEERRNNIVFKGINGVENIKDGREWVKKFLNEKLDLDLEGKVTQTRISGKVLIAKLDSEEVKREVMKRKNKLKDGYVFIENDLTWEERKIQEKINVWAKVQRSKGKEIKIGFGKVRINGVWKYWKEIEKEEEEDVRRERDREIEEGDKEFWDYIIGYDYIGLSETWLDEKGWKGIKEKLPESHIWKNLHAKRDKKKGRVKGGLLIGIKKGWGKEEDIHNTTEVAEGISYTKIIEEGLSLNIFTVYNSGAKNDIEECLIKIIEDYEEEGIIIEGDFNIRIGELGKVRDIGNERERKSKDKVIGNGGRKLIDMIYEKRWYILNGRTEGDWEREYTSYVGERVDSDHMPLIMELETEEDNNDREKKVEEKEEEKEEMRRIISWNEEAREMYREKTEEDFKERAEEETWSVEKRWERIKDIILKAIIYKEIKKQKKRKIGYKDWWDRSCTKKKREMKKKYRR